MNCELQTYLKHREFVRENCWLVNLKGGTEDFAAIDLVEEHTVKNVKVTYRPKGLNLHDLPRDWAHGSRQGEGRTEAYGTLRTRRATRLPARADGHKLSRYCQRVRQ